MQTCWSHFLPLLLEATPFPCHLTTGGVDVSTLAAVQRPTRWYGAGTFSGAPQGWAKTSEAAGENESFPIEEFSLSKTLQIDTCGSNALFI